MKKQTRNVFKSILAASLFIGFSSTATAQGNLIARNDNQAEVVRPTEFEGDETSSREAAADARASRNFSKQFTGIADAKWTKINTGYVVRFTQDGIQNMVFLTKKGSAYITSRYITENELPALVRKDVKNAYADFNITSVTEVHMNNEPTVYLITITGLNTWKEISVADGEIKVRGEYIKG
jgi:hypothetical protein